MKGLTKCPQGLVLQGLSGLLTGEVGSCLTSPSSSHPPPLGEKWYAPLEHSSPHGHTSPSKCCLSQEVSLGCPPLS
jgi:hypothetical protein